MSELIPIITKLIGLRLITVRLRSGWDYLFFYTYVSCMHRSRYRQPIRKMSYRNINIVFENLVCFFADNSSTTFSKVSSSKLKGFRSNITLTVTINFNFQLYFYLPYLRVYLLKKKFSKQLMPRYLLGKISL